MRTAVAARLRRGLTAVAKPITPGLDHSRRVVRPVVPTATVAG